MSTGPDQDLSQEIRQGRRRELLVFFLLAVVIWPLFAIGFVGGYGFLVWIWQIFTGPPGPPG